MSSVRQVRARVRPSTRSIGQRSGAQRAFAVGLLAVVLLLTGCRPDGHATTPEPTGPAPEPSATGALYGRVIRPDGRAANQATVSLAQVTKEDQWRTGFALVASLGLLCLIPSFCGGPEEAEVSADGQYSYPASKMKSSPDLVISAAQPAAPGQSIGPRTVATVKRGVTPQRLPDLILWEPEITVTEAGVGSARVSWSPLPAAAAHGGRVSYAVAVRVVAQDSGKPELVSHPTTGTSALVDTRPYEDASIEVVVMADAETSVDARQVSYGYQSGGQGLLSAGPAPSRGLPCLADDNQRRLRPTVTPCPLTDGDLERHAEVWLPGGCSVEADNCTAESHQRLCIDLGARRSISLVVFRTPFLRDRAVVEFSPDGKRFISGGRPAHSEHARTVYSLPLKSPAQARIVCVRDQFSGSVLSELSAWW
ncbi:hypothetical protein ABGB07_14725 [Micromonosporaceae bacterium B7E4]